MKRREFLTDTFFESSGLSLSSALPNTFSKDWLYSKIHHESFIRLMEVSADRRNLGSWTRYRSIRFIHPLQSDT